MTFRRKFTIIGILFLIGYGLIIWVNRSTLQRVMINGPLYVAVARNKDLIADILPPSYFVLEPYLLAYQMTAAKSPEALNQFSARMQKCESEYKERNLFWTRELKAVANGGDGKMLNDLLDESRDPALQFFKIVNSDLMPALTRGDRVLAESILHDKLTPAFERHRASIDKSVAAANRTVQAHELNAAASVAQGKWVTMTVSLIVLGIVAGGAAIMLRSVLTSLRSVTDRLRIMAEGDADLTARLGITTQDEVGTLARYVDSFFEKISVMVRASTLATRSLTNTAIKMHTTSQQQESAFSQFGASTTEIAAAVRQISTTGKELLSTMGEVELAATNSATTASLGRTGLTDMRSAMQLLVASSSSISEKLEAIHTKTRDISGIVLAITKVADQTNLLSVNAAIEAEKAGENGRGFLVVAREIRRLADQTAGSTLDIERTVTQMRSAVSAGVMEMDRFSAQVNQSVQEVESIGQRLTQVIDGVDVIQGRFEEVTQGMTSQNLGAQQISEAMVNLSANVTNSVHSLSEFTQAADQLRESIGSLNTELGRFKTGSD